MRIGTSTATTISTIALACTAVLFAPTATALPNCVNTSQRTTQCETGGSTQIVTTPPDINYGFPWWGFGIFPFGI
ncbi:hypothetical protein NIIDNTM18_43910 [Mycolicibacterium litorale]|uniref:Uncharacterized protein n=1 Tax=Mycolicibacterium litorale TaxID=758802 RepID=A0A6S6P5H7_9MYCO|nr:hypothetical protein [Mycolicibacterium litorale]BCI55113.1 hypothetical protein NIIDNTM18_43910 [Mycolicibacterium litorale]